MKRIGIMVLAGLLAMSCFAELFGGTIAFKDGGSVEFVRMGNDVPHMCKLYGKLGGQRVEYKFEDLGQIIFSGGRFSSANGEAIVVAKSGKRFSLTECTVNWRSVKGAASSGELVYRYLDAVTHQEQNSTEKCEKIASIMMGKATGTVKKSPTTGEYFPSMYNFDPFTGEKLEWANRDE